MSIDRATPVEAAEDGYASYYAEKLWTWVPELYRNLDRDPPANGALRAIVEIVAAEAATLRRDSDRLWDDQSIALCDEWAVAYLGSLAGAVPVSEFNARGNRLSAARAVFYQRRNGTPALMQELIRDMTGAEGVIVEAFRRLTRFPHRLDIDAIAYRAVTGTPAHGLIDLRNPRVKGLHDSGFDEAAHFPDIRRLRGTYGRYGLKKVNFHIYPVASIELILPTPHLLAPGQSTLDPSGRDVALYQRGQTADRAPDAIRETDLPAPILCRRFNATSHVLTAETLAKINDPALDSALAPLLGWRFRSGPDFREVVGRRLSPAQEATYMGLLLDATMVANAPKAVLTPDSLSLSEAAESGEDPEPPHRLVAAALDNWGGGLAFAPEIKLVIDPDTGRMIDGPARGSDPVFVEKLHYGQFWPTGAGAYSRRVPASADTEVDAGATGAGGGFTDPGPLTGFSLPVPLTGHHRFTTSRTYEPDMPAGQRYSGITSARIDAADAARPLVRYRADAGSLDLTFEAAAGSGDRVLEIDGLWLALLAAAPVPEETGDPDIPPTPVRARIVLDGYFDRVVLSHVTLDPGGEMARLSPAFAIALPYTVLEIAGQVNELILSRCITGPVQEELADPDSCNAGTITICDSIVTSIAPGEPAIRTTLGHLYLERSTVFGRVEVQRLYATDSIVDGRITVTDNQHGCFRYSATGAYGNTAVLPRQFEELVVPGMLSRHWFTSRRFGDAWFGALSWSAPQAVTRAASNGSEMGAFNSRGLAVLMGDLAAQTRHYLPVGEIPQFILERDKERIR